MLFRAISIALICLFCIDTVAIANPNTLAPMAGNPIIYQKIRGMMEERLAAHQEPIDEFIKKHVHTAKDLSPGSDLEKEFMEYISACNANDMLTRLRVTLAPTGGRIQVIFVKSEDELPIFDGKMVWGHSGTYVTAFALESEKNSKEGRRKIIARLFHEIRARSTRARELFDEKLKDKTLTTPEEAAEFVKSMREEFENYNLKIQQEIEQNNCIITLILSKEFENLTFAIHPDVINRDYTMSKQSHNPEISDNVQNADIENIDKVIADIRVQLAKVDGRKLRRKYINEDIKRLLLSLRRDNKEYFSPKQANRISRLRKLNEKLGVLRLLFLCKDSGVFVFKNIHLTPALDSARKEAEIGRLINALKSHGITKGTHLTPIILSAREESEIYRLIDMLKSYGITKDTHIASILSSARKEAEIDRIITKLKSLGITAGAHLALVLHSSRKEEDIFSYANKLMELKAKMSDSEIPDPLTIVRMIENPESITRDFSYMLKEKAKLPPLDRLISDEEKEYIRFRLFLRQFGLSTLYGLIDIFAENSGKGEEIKKHISERIKEENVCLSTLLKVKIFSEGNYKEVGLLLFSCDEKVRTKVRDALIERHFDRVNRYKDKDKKSVAGELLLALSTRYNIYHGLLTDDLRHPSYIAYLESYMRYINIILHRYNQPESLRQMEEEFRKFKTQFDIEGSEELSEQDLIDRFSEEEGYGVEAVLLALGRLNGISLDKRNGNGTMLMDFISAEPDMPDDLIGSIFFDSSVAPESLFPIDRIKAELTRRSVPIDLKVEVKEMDAKEIQLRLLNEGKVMAALTMVIPPDELEIEGLSSRSLPKTHVLATNDTYYTVTKKSLAWNEAPVETRIYYNLKKRVEIRDFKLTEYLRGNDIGSVWYKERIEPYLRKCNAPIASVFGTCLESRSVYEFWERQGFDQQLTLNVAYCKDTVQRIMLFKVLPEPKVSENKLRPIEQLDWKDEVEVLGHFRALLAELGWPLPRVIPIDGNIAKSVVPKALNIASLKKLAQGKSPDDYLRYLRRGEDLPELYNSIAVPFLKEFGILPLWSIWFRYHDQLKSITEYVDTLPKDKPVKILVHAVWKGEDAYAIAIALKHLYPDRIFEITGLDFIEPNPQELNWVYVKRIPKYLRGAINKYFTYKTKDVVALKDECGKLITLRQGDMREPGSFSKGLDIVVINAALGQSVNNKDDIRQSIENARASLAPGGRFYTDNSAYRAHPVQKVRVDEILRKDFVETGKFNRIADGVFEKVDAPESVKAGDGVNVAPRTSKEISLDPSVAPESLFPIQEIRSELTKQNMSVDLKVEVKEMTPEKIQLKLLSAGEEVAALTLAVSPDQLEIEDLAVNALPKNHILATDDMYYTVTKVSSSLQGPVETRVYHNLKKRVEIQRFGLVESLRGKGIGPVWYQNYIEPYLRKCDVSIVSAFGECLTAPSVYVFWGRQGFCQSLPLNFLYNSDIVGRSILLKVLPEPKAPEKEARPALPQEWYTTNPKAADFTAGLAESLPIENILDPGISTFIFSENVTFNKGLGVFLPKLAKSGMKITVIATTEKERALIDELNKSNIPDSNNKIICHDTIIEAAQATRCYYFRVNGEPEVKDQRNVTTFILTDDIVNRIIDAIGKVCGIAEGAKLKLLHDAALKFNQSA